MHTHTHTHKFAFTFVFMPVFTSMFTFVFSSIFASTFTSIFTSTFTPIFTSIFTSILIYVYMRVVLDTYMCTSHLHPSRGILHSAALTRLHAAARAHRNTHRVTFDTGTLTFYENRKSTTPVSQFVLPSVSVFVELQPQKKLEMCVRRTRTIPPFLRYHPAHLPSTGASASSLTRDAL